MRKGHCMSQIPPQKFGAEYVAHLRELLDIAAEQIGPEHRTLGSQSGDSRGGDTSYHEHGLARRRATAPHQGTFRYLMVMREWRGVFPASVTSDLIKSDLPERVCPDVTENLNNHASHE